MLVLLRLARREPRSNQPSLMRPFTGWPREISFFFFFLGEGGGGYLIIIMLVTAQDKECM